MGAAFSIHQLLCHRAGQPQANWKNLRPAPTINNKSRGVVDGWAGCTAADTFG